uniref:C3H1-type domain-containing protein n=1 Tax=Pithovirus LCDPAC02 TaxID=2506601 RepID=A0A481YQZ9_9VIRU|nr:MAG: hypothetical protein LCDPAC02_00550 [Pithovirus LCDPAC02]
MNSKLCKNYDQGMCTITNCKFWHPKYERRYLNHGEKIEVIISVLHKGLYKALLNPLCFYKCTCDHSNDIIESTYINDKYTYIKYVSGCNICTSFDEIDIDDFLFYKCGYYFHDKKIEFGKKFIGYCIDKYGYNLNGFYNHMCHKYTDFSNVEYINIILNSYHIKHRDELINSDKDLSDTIYCIITERLEIIKKCRIILDEKWEKISKEESDKIYDDRYRELITSMKTNINLILFDYLISDNF